jgi:hypothetical protein
MTRTLVRSKPQRSDGPRARQGYSDPSKPSIWAPMGTSAGSDASIPASTLSGRARIQPNCRVFRDGRGWFRTSDLSRVKRGIPRCARGAGIRIAKPNSSPCGPATGGPRITRDYARLPGIRAERAAFCPERGPVWPTGGTIRFVKRYSWKSGRFEGFRFAWKATLPCRGRPRRSRSHRDSPGSGGASARCSRSARPHRPRR